MSTNGSKGPSSSSSSSAEPLTPKPHPDLPADVPPVSPSSLLSPTPTATIPLPDWFDKGSGRKIRVYADGVFDLFHFGHARSLEQAKILFGVDKNGEPLAELIAGVCSDADTQHYKGPTVMTESERAESVRHCKWVDEVVCPCPWTITQDFMDRHRIDVVVHGEDDQTYDGGDVYAFVKAQDKFRFIKRTGGISTSDIICRIVRNHDTYLRRNFRRGYTREELNVGFLTEKMVRLEDSIEPVVARVARVNEAIERGLAGIRQRTDQGLQGLRSTVTDAYANVVDKFHRSRVRKGEGEEGKDKAGRAAGEAAPITDESAGEPSPAKRKRKA